MKQQIRRSVRIALFLAMSACSTPAKPVVTTTTLDSLRGTWRVLPFPPPPDSVVSQLPFGVAPVGYLVYDVTGHVFWQVFRPSAMDSIKIGRQRQVPDSILMRLSKGYAAQFGTYTVDINAHTVTHHYEGELQPWREGFEVATPFRLNGDSLFLSGWRFLRVK